jgi:rare lipoprotein A (peptidoglycan hydrolase)
MSASLVASLGVQTPGHKSSVCGDLIHVTNSANGKSIVVTVLDLRGNEHGLDLQTEAFNMLDDGRGVAAGQINVAVRLA